MTAPCFRLDDYLDGRLSDADAEAFETHTLTCVACDAALEEAAPDLSALGDVTCPPAVVEAALRTARRAPALAPDRAPAGRQRSRRRFAVAPLALAAALAVAVGLGVTLDRGSDGPAQPIAEAVTPAEEPAASATEVAPTEPPPSATDAPTAPAPPAPRPAPAPATRPAPPPAPEPMAPPSGDLVAQADPAPEPPEPDPTPEEIEAAREDLALAFHLVAEAQTQARQAVRAEATPLTHTIDRALPF